MRKLLHPHRRPVGGNDRELEGDRELGQDLSGGLHDGEVRVAAHDDGNEGVTGVERLDRGRLDEVGVPFRLSVRPRKERSELTDLVANFGVRSAHDRDVTHLPSLPAARFPVEVNRRAEFDGFGDYTGGLEEVGTGVGGVTEEVEHGSGGGDELDGGEGVGEDGVEVGGVLGDVAGFDGVVTRVVGSGSNLVEEERACEERKRSILLFSRKKGNGKDAPSGIKNISTPKTPTAPSPSASIAFCASSCARSLTLFP
jgi:hypothetical protein